MSLRSNAEPATFKQLRAKSGLSQAELAGLTEFSLREVKRWESGESTPRAVVIEFLKNRIAAQAAEPRSGDFSFIDLFAGIGGLRLAFEATGGACVFTSEWDEYSKKTYKANFGNEDIQGDITKIDVKDVPDHDVLLAGFPCQPFSLAGVSKKNALGRAHGFECETQGTLFFDIERIIAAKQPKAFLLENVKNLLSHDSGKTFRVIRDVLENKLGYRIFPKVIDGRKFVPQHRERIYIVGFREAVPFSWDDIQWPDKIEWPTLSSILHPQDGTERPESPFTNERGKVDRKYTLSDKLWEYLQGYAKKHQAKGNGFGFGLVRPGDVARTLSARYYKDGSEILVHQKGKNPRRLTPRECARLMGFDRGSRHFVIPVSDTRAYKQFGNSVVVPVVDAIAKAMRPYILGERGEKVQLDLELAAIG